MLPVGSSVAESPWRESAFPTPQHCPLPQSHLACLTLFARTALIEARVDIKAPIYTCLLLRASGRDVEPGGYALAGASLREDLSHLKEMKSFLYKPGQVVQVYKTHLSLLSPTLSTCTVCASTNRHVILTFLDLLMTYIRGRERELRRRSISYSVGVQEGG